MAVKIIGQYENLMCHMKARFMLIPVLYYIIATINSRYHLTKKGYLLTRPDPQKKLK